MNKESLVTDMPMPVFGIPKHLILSPAALTLYQQQKKRTQAATPSKGRPQAAKRRGKNPRLLRLMML